MTFWATFVATTSLADGALCPNGQVTVDASTSTLHAHACTEAQNAIAALAGCGLPIERPLAITVTDDMLESCLGLYHCGEDRIEIPAPAALAAGLHPESIYQSLPPDVLFTSVLTHELAHAATDNMPCPFESCLLGQEYISYVMQFRAIPDALRAPLIEDRLQRRISRDELSVMVLWMAPDLFAQGAWMHFTQRDDPCGFIRQIADGTVLLDKERF